MLNKIFGKKRHKEIQAETEDMEFIGEPEGSGLHSLRLEVAKRLKQFDYVINAYLSRLRYRGEQNNRIALVIDSKEPSKKVGAEVAGNCSGIAPMDIIFSDSIPPELADNIRTKTTPLYSDGNLLFECPLVVERGSNNEMPEKWKGAIITYYVAAQDYEAALYKAANELKSEGYIFSTVFEGKVNQLDPNNWWDGIVMEKWAEYSDHFPSQEDMKYIVITGGIHKGPCLGWENETKNT